jgi:hypothetical protein
MASDVISIPVDRIHLFEENPRHGLITDPEEVIDYLCQDEQVLVLAESIVEVGETNPLELIGVVRIDDEEDAGDPTYEVWEGNRRVCAVMLLNDPDKAPAKWRKRFKELATGFPGIETLDGRVFDDKPKLRFWMRNIHGGEQGGRGRKGWDAQAIQRDVGGSKNAFALFLLDEAERRGIISKIERKNKITTLQRYATALRPILEVDDRDPTDVTFNRAEDEFDALLRQVMNDLLANRIRSRHNEPEIREYAASLEERAGVIRDPGPDTGGGAGGAGGGGGSGGGGQAGPKGSGPDDDDPPRRPQPTKVKRHAGLATAIGKLGSDKLDDLYGSITKVSASSNPQLVAVGVWALIETIACICGATNSFPSFFSKGTLSKLGFQGDKATALHVVFERLSRAGNTTKHDAIGGAFDHRQLINDMEVVSPALAKALNDLT